MMKKYISILLSVLVILCFASCDSASETVSSVESSTGFAIPDVTDVDESSAKNILSSNGLIPVVKYEYSDTVDSGNVIRTEPETGMNVEKNSKVTVYISEGPSYVSCSQSSLHWYNLSSKGEDEWSFNNPYISNGIMYIECDAVTFGVDMEWKDVYSEGELFGEASINDTFDKTISIRAKYQKKSWKANETQQFTLEVPLADLDVSKPTDLYIRLHTVDSGSVRANFYITW